MGVSAVTRRLVWVRSGGQCVFPDCGLDLSEVASGDGAAIGEIAHIVASSPDGPRGASDLPGGVDSVENLLLLCPTHHTKVDREPQTFTVQRLVGIKSAHEDWVRAQLHPTRIGAPKREPIDEMLHSTIFPVESMPLAIYSAPCLLPEGDLGGRLGEAPGDEMLPFIVREGRIMTFWDLDADPGPFAPVLETGGEIVRESAETWWTDEDRSRWYVTLLNRALNKITGRLGLNLDKDHHRYFFEANRDEDGTILPVEVTYKSLNRRSSSRSAVWQPKRRSTGDLRNYWIHLAVSLRFHRVGELEWVLSVRPERRFTRDGVEPLVPKSTGRRSTSLKSHLYNYDVLGEVQFWKDFLSQGEPFINFNFGSQSLIVLAEALAANILWPGVPDDLKPYSNAYAEFDLFSAESYHRAVEKNERQEAELEYWEVEDLVALEEDN